MVVASVCAPQWKVGDFPAAGAANALCACAGKRPSFLCASTTNLLWWTHALSDIGVGLYACLVLKLLPAEARVVYLGWIL